MLTALRHMLLPSAPGAFRLWLALIVVFHHVTRIEVGKAPVLVFFALSGYWVQQVWTGRYQQAAQPWVTFAVSRWWRIAPVLILAVALSLAVMVLLGDGQAGAAVTMPVRQAFSSVFALGYAQMPVRPLGPAWSLDIEMQFYLAAPLLAALVRRTSAIVALFVAFMSYTAGLALYPELVLTSFLVPFLLGMVAAHHRWSVSPRVGQAGQIMAILVVVVLWLSPLRAATLGPAQDSWWPQLNILLAALLLPQALVSVQGRGGPRDQLWADQSYVIYMLHWPAILLLRGIVWPSGLAWAAGLIAIGLATMALCWAVHRFYDRPLNRARARWVARRREQGAAQATKGDDSAPAFA